MATPLRELVGKQDNVQVLLGEVTTVNPEGKQRVVNGKAYSYDHLILATGSGTTYFFHEDWRTFAPPIKILEHAEEIRRRLLMAMQQMVFGGSRPTFRYVDFAAWLWCTPVQWPTCMASNFPDTWACRCGPSFTWP